MEQTMSLSPVLSEAGRFLPGFIIFPLAFIYIRRYFRRRLSCELQWQSDDSRTISTGDKNHTSHDHDDVDNNCEHNGDDSIEWDANTIATRMVSGINALIMIVTGTITVITTIDDIKYDRSPVIEPYIYLCLPYMMYDLVVMYLTYQSEHPERKQRSFQQSLKFYFVDNTTIVTHHIMLALLCPVYLYFLGGIGDFIVGTFCIQELSTPFLSLRVIIRHLKLDVPRFSQVNDVIFMVLFFICRVLMMPFCYWSVGRYFGISILEVPFFIPVKCNVLSGLLWGMQLHWFHKILKKTMETLRGVKNNRQRTSVSKGKKSTILASEVNGKLNGNEINSNNHYHKE